MKIKNQRTEVGHIYNIENLNISQNSPAIDMIKLIDSLKDEVDKLNINETNKKNIDNLLDNANVELKGESPDKNSIVESIKQTNEILKEAKTTGESLKDIGVLVAKAAIWLKVSTTQLGWHF